MSGLTRRKFLEKASLGAAAAGGIAGGLATGLVALPRLAGLAGRTHETPVTTLGDTQSDAVVAHVRDLATGEVSVMVGTNEVVYRDPELVARLLGATRHAVVR